MIISAYQFVNPQREPPNCIDSDGRTCVNVLAVTQCKDRNVCIDPYICSQLDGVVFIIQGVPDEFFSRSYPDLVAPCFGIHPLQAGGGSEQRSATPQVFKQSAPLPSSDCLTLMILRKRAAQLRRGPGEEKRKAGVFLRPLEEIKVYLLFP